MSVRVATFADARAIAEVHVASWRAGYRGLVAPELLEALSVAERERQWIEYLEGVQVLIQESGAGVHGFVAFDEPTAEIKALYVAPERFRQGVGSALLTAAHAALQAAGHDEATLWVFADNAAARAFYQRHGYAPDGATATNARTGLEEVRLWRSLRGRVSDVEDSARGLANLAHVLRECVHLTSGEIEHEPRLELKCLLADHLHDDALALRELHERIARLGQDARGPGDQLAAWLDHAAAAPVDTVYGELKPALVHHARAQIERLDPLLEEPTLRSLTQLVHRQERHTTELPVSRPGGDAAPDLTALPPGEPRHLAPRPPATRPARDAFVEIAEHAAEPPQDLQRYAHALLEARLEAAERAARALHEAGDADPARARAVWDAARHAEALDQLMASELDCHWGDFPVSLGAAPPGEPPAPPPPAMARVLAYIRAETA